MNDVPAIECRGLRKQFAEGPAVLEVLKDINLVIGAGERIALDRPSVAGGTRVL